MEYPDCHVDDEMERGNFDVGFHVEGTELESFHSIPMFSSPIRMLLLFFAPKIFTTLRQ